MSIVLLSSCKNDEQLAAPAPIANQSFQEEFDTVSAALGRGWILINASNPRGINVWQQGGNIVPWFRAFSNNGSNAGFIGADYTSTSAGVGLINNWLISPELTIQNGDTLSFYTRAVVDDASAAGLTDSTDYANRLQVLASTAGSSTTIGTQAPGGQNFRASFGDFGILLIDINSSYRESHTDASLFDPLAYPTRWTKFTAVITQLSKPERGRIAFRYIIDGGGFSGAGNGVAIDKVEYKSVSR